jgi:hypothetical protein
VALSDEDVEFLGDWLKASEEAIEDLDRKVMTIVNDLSAILSLMRWVVFAPLLIIPFGLFLFLLFKA